MREQANSAQPGEQGDGEAASGVKAAAVRAQLARILASPSFDASERNRRFLEHVVEETLAGRGERIKAYGVALEVFARDDSFDAQSDPIVRIEASRLRRSLERYYLLAGQDDPVRIEIPKGGYMAAFKTTDADAAHTAAPAPSAEAPAAAAQRPQTERTLTVLAFCLVLIFAGLAGGWALATYWPGRTAAGSGAAGRGPVLLAVPFEDDGSQVQGDVRQSATLVHGFSREVVAGLARFGGLSVFDAETAGRSLGEADMQRLAALLDADFLLTGGVSVSDDRFAVTASLIDSASGRHIWSGHFDGDVTAASIIAVRDQLAGRVVQELAQPYGVLFGEQMREQEGRPPAELTSYECVLRFHRYWRELDRDGYSPVRQCLERTIVADPDYAQALAALALLLADGYRLGYDPDGAGGGTLPRALALARRAVELAPADSQGYVALQLVYWLMNDVERSLAAGERGLALNPNDTELLAELGRRYCLRGMFDIGVPMIDEAFARNPILPGHYRIGPFLARYAAGDYAAALIEARRIGIPDTVFGHIALAMAHAKLGNTSEAAAAVERILAIDPAYGDHVRLDLAKRALHPELIETVVDGLRLAGLAVAATPSPSSY
jgi:TolB-like protein